MNLEDKTKYFLEIIKGEGLRLTEIAVSRLDYEPIRGQEKDDLEAEFNNSLPKEIYSVKCQTRPDEDDELLHIYINLQNAEIVRRGGALGSRIIVKREEIAERLQGWYIV